ncbi:protein kinase [Streptomyces sp. NPDC001380]|uniref:protein kinase domain-containing protein n=1 Tax=Streptomyces sp. NPDC001380 TaxID=3364566 RepID=UPI0036C66096
MRLHPLHPAAWVLDRIRDSGWQVYDLLAFTRASTLVLVGHDGDPPVVLKAGFGSNHVLAELDHDIRPAAYGFYWYAQTTPQERALARDNFRHEAATAQAATGAPHVVPLLEQGSCDRFDWYTMPYFPQGNVRSLLVSGPEPEPRRLAAGLGILADAATGLHALHQRGIVHRDVYQENILVHDGRGLITDLGAARHTDRPRGPAGRGPEVHWPPEYATAYDRATPAADVFSLAVLVHRLLCADIPRLGGHPRLATAPAPLRPLIAAALAPEPADRPAMDELRDALRQAAATTALPARRGT